MKMHDTTNGLELCGCGNCDDALDAALRFARQNFKMDGDQCPVWFFGVARFMAEIATHMMDAWGVKKLQEEYPDMPLDVVRGHVYDGSGNAQERVTKFIVASFFKREDNCRKLADFVCEEVGSDLERDLIMQGPTEGNMEEMGFAVVRPNESPLEAILRRIVPEQDNQEAPPEGVKPH